MACGLVVHAGAGVGCVVLATLFATPLRRIHSGNPCRNSCLHLRQSDPAIRRGVRQHPSPDYPRTAASAITLLTVLLHWPRHRCPAGQLAGHRLVFMGGAISAGVAGFAKLLISFAHCWCSARWH